ncbi:chloride channel protein [uncultured Nisaea sp.]|uniref:chloride channel protein n=1 Tax=uncultured Nisaea sp. TaxID=538215 RepID=UPI0030EDF86C|tara:strand:- start:888 stop:2702 length:1815 start_codon:yes stop_codon:yes gene_type:complete
MVRDYLSAGLRGIRGRAAAGIRNEQVLLSALAVAVGTAAAFAAVLFRELIGLIQTGFYGFGHERVVSGVAGLAWWHLLLAPALGGLLIGLYIHYFMPGRRPQGVADVIEANALRAGRMSGRAGLGAALVSAASIGAGASVGREGPAVHLGATIASYMGRRFRLARSQSRTLLGCGVAAAVAASFNAPVAGVFFALEVVIGHYALTAFAPIVIASVAGTIVARVYFGDVPAFAMPPHEIASFLEFGAFALLGITAAGAAIAFMRLMTLMQSLVDRTRLPYWLRPAIGGLAVGGIAIFYPELLGVGYEAMDSALNEHYLLGTLILLALLKMLATAISFGFGFGGGMFSPSLFIGAMVGGSFGIMASIPYPNLSSGHGAYTLVGMGAVSGAVLGAPISTMLIIVELTGDYRLTIAVMVAVVIASLLTRTLNGPSFFHKQLEARGVMVRGGHDVEVLGGLTVSNLIHEEVSTVSRDAGLAEVRAALLASGNGVVFVTNSDGRLLGSLTLAGLGQTAFSAGDGEESDFDLKPFLDTSRPSLLESERLGAVMESFAEVSDGVLPVVKGQEAKTLIGWLDEADVMRTYNRALEQIRDEEHGDRTKGNGYLG